MTDDAPVAPNRIERLLLTMAGSVGGLSILSILIIVIAQVAGVRDFSTGAWPMIQFVPFVGLPIAAVLILVFLVSTLVRRGRAAAGR